jgi:hypothetical protein
MQTTARHLAPVIAALIVISVRILTALLTVLTAQFIIPATAPKWSPTYLTDTFIWSLFSFLVGMSCRVWADERCFLTSDNEEPFVSTVLVFERYASIILGAIVGICGVAAVLVPSSLNPLLLAVLVTFGVVIAYPVIGRLLRKRGWL